MKPDDLCCTKIIKYYMTDHTDIGVADDISEDYLEPIKTLPACCNVLKDEPEPLHDQMILHHFPVVSAKNNDVKLASAPPPSPRLQTWYNFLFFIFNPHTICRKRANIDDLMTVLGTKHLQDRMKTIKSQQKKTEVWEKEKDPKKELNSWGDDVRSLHNVMLMMMMMISWLESIRDNWGSNNIIWIFSKNLQNIIKK